MSPLILQMYWSVFTIMKPDRLTEQSEVHVGATTRADCGNNNTICGNNYADTRRTCNMHAIQPRPQIRSCSVPKIISDWNFKYKSWFTVLILLLLLLIIIITTTMVFPMFPLLCLLRAVEDVPLVTGTHRRAACDVGWQRNVTLWYSPPHLQLPPRTHLIRWGPR